MALLRKSMRVSSCSKLIAERQSLWRHKFSKTSTMIKNVIFGHWVSSCINSSMASYRFQRTRATVNSYKVSSKNLSRFHPNPRCPKTLRNFFSNAWRKNLKNVTVFKSLWPANGFYKVKTKNSKKERKRFKKS